MPPVVDDVQLFAKSRPRTLSRHPRKGNENWCLQVKRRIIAVAPSANWYPDAEFPTL